MHFSWPLRLHYTTIRPFCDRAAANSKKEQDKVNNADSAFIFLIIQSQNQWSSRKRWPCLVWSLLER